MRKKILSCLIVLAVAVSFMPTMAFAASKVKMTAYNQVLKSNNIVYCSGAGGVYKVTPNGKVTRLYKTSYPETENCIQAMKLKGNYLYFKEYGAELIFDLYRVNVNSGKHKRLVKEMYHYAIKGKKIYVHKMRNGSDKVKRIVIKLNGKKAKGKKRKVKEITKNSNVKNYRIKTVVNDDGYAKDYLIMPNGKAKYLGAIWMDW